MLTIWSTCTISLLLGSVLIEPSFGTPEVLFSGKQYVKFTPKPSKWVIEKKSINRIKLKFRTIHPSGVLLVMVGQREEALVLQLIQGRIRYLLTRGNDVIQGILGNNLNNDKWHTVKIMRTGQINEIQVDQTTKLLLSPPTYENLSFLKAVYIAGYDSNKHQTLRRSIQTTTLYTGCLLIVDIDNQDPILYYQEGNKYVETVPYGGTLSFGCPIHQAPIEFLKPLSYVSIDLHRNKTYMGVHISLSIRTYSLAGYVLSNEGVNCGVQLTLKDGRICLKAWQGTGIDVAHVESTQQISNGLWHRIDVSVIQHEVMLMVNYDKFKSSVRLRVPFSCATPDRLLLGSKKLYHKRSFVGCLHHIKVFDHTIYIFRNKNTEHITMKHVTPGCKLGNKCFPNPCLNNGRCIQTWRETLCDCTGLNIYGKNCEKSIYRSSCAAYQKLGLNETSYCLIDSDGTGTLPPHTTLCEFTNHRDVYTVINHNKKSAFAATEGDEKFYQYTFHQLKYDLEIKQLQKLIKKSKGCRQRISFRCYNTYLLNAPDGAPNVIWRSVKGESKSYWGGAPTDGKGCSCGVNKSCLTAGKLCNCDSWNNHWAQDTGYITDKESLPITRLDVTGMDHGKAYFNIGPLECYGEEITGNIDKEKQTKNLLQHICISAIKTMELVNKANKTMPKYMTIQRNTLQPTTQTYTRQSTIPALPHQPKLTNYTQETSSLTILEIIFIVAAGLATLLLTTKYVACSLFHKLNGQVILKHHRDKYFISETFTGLQSNKVNKKGKPSVWWV